MVMIHDRSLLWFISILSETILPTMNIPAVYMIAHDVIFQSSNCKVTSRPLHQYTLITTDIILLLSLLFIIITIQIHNRLNEVQVYIKDKEPMHYNQMILGFGLTNIQRFCEKEVSEYVHSSTTVEEKKHLTAGWNEIITNHLLPLLIINCSFNW